MVAFNTLVGVALLYVAFLFFVAFAAERRAAAGRGGWLQSPVIYTLSLSVYCTAWTFYGAVGNAARTGLEYLTIYLGPSLVMLGWWWLLRKLVRIGRVQRITSIADLISSRFGKSTSLGVLVTVMCVAGVAPYIALQLQSVTLSFSVFAGASGRLWNEEDLNTVALLSALGLAVFTVLFGTRNLDSSERHHGVVMAIAVEAVVKLAALLAIGGFVVWGISGGVSGTLARIEASEIAVWDQSAGRWVGLTFLSAAAFVCLPRMFQVMVVENANEKHLATASWAFPLYLMLMSLFVVPIAVVGLDLLPGGNPDLYVLTIPLREGREGLAALGFLGGFSSATSMVIVATIALATMVSNHIVVPIWLRSRTEGAVISGDIRDLVLLSRRFSIVGILMLGYIYYRVSGGGSALAAIGLISFVGVAQMLPALIGAIFWRGATGIGAASGLCVGFAIWAWTLFLPSFEGLLSQNVLDAGPFGLGWLRPEALFGIEGLDPLMHATFWSILLNLAAFVAGSLFSFPRPLERLQGAQFVNVLEQTVGSEPRRISPARAEDLLIMSQRILGPSQAQSIFQRAAEAQGKAGFLPEVTPAFLVELERDLAGSVGAATAHAMLGQFAEGNTVSVEDLMAVADETAQILEYSTQLEAKSVEQELTARALRDANKKLTALSIQKDAFLSQISHELRTPMTSIRSFSELLQSSDLPAENQHRFAAIIEAEAQRLTRLLDELLDLSVLENGQVVIHPEDVVLKEVLDRALTSAGLPSDQMTVERSGDEGIAVKTDLDRLSQVFINLLANARKYCDAPRPHLKIDVGASEAGVVVEFADNGSGISTENQTVIFEKFSRLGDHSKAGGAGLGLAICREIMNRLGGAIEYVPGRGGAVFRVTLPSDGQSATS